MLFRLSAWLEITPSRKGFDFKSAGMFGLELAAIDERVKFGCCVFFKGNDRVSFAHQAFVFLMIIAGKRSPCRDWPIRILGQLGHVEEPS